MKKLRMKILVALPLALAMLGGTASVVSALPNDVLNNLPCVTCESK